MRLQDHFVTNVLNAIQEWHRRRPVTYPSRNRRYYTILIINAMVILLIVIAKVKLEHLLWSPVAFLATILMYVTIFVFLCFTSFSNGFAILMGWNKLDFSDVYKVYKKRK